MGFDKRILLLVDEQLIMVSESPVGTLGVNFRCTSLREPKKYYNM